jgi:ribosomal protein S18 acetylase RimI-like enzyme
MGESSEILVGFSIALSATADAEARDFIRQQLRAFNDTHSEHHRAIRSAEPTPLDILIRSEAGEILGGLISSTYWGWLEVNILWVAEGLRRLGHGRTLLRMAEAEARTRDCSHVMLTTYSFQARGFYEKEGYRVAGEMAGYPPGATYYWMRKDL